MVGAAHINHDYSAVRCKPELPGTGEVAVGEPLPLEPADGTKRRMQRHQPATPRQLVRPSNVREAGRQIDHSKRRGRAPLLGRSARRGPLGPLGPEEEVAAAVKGSGPLRGVTVRGACVPLAVRVEHALAPGPKPLLRCAWRAVGDALVRDRSRHHDRVLCRVVAEGPRKGKLVEAVAQEAAQVDRLRGRERERVSLRATPE